jgi:predicted TIM-barrel fold metal-dependent hydrolase
MMLTKLLKAGLAEAELETMIKTNPARLLNLD